MKYRDAWDLTTIPKTEFYAEVSRRRGAKRKAPYVRKETDDPHAWDLTTIPDDKFYAEVSRRRGAKRKAPYVFKETDDPVLAEKRRKKRESVAAYRAKRKNAI